MTKMTTKDGPDFLWWLACALLATFSGIVFEQVVRHYLDQHYYDTAESAVMEIITERYGR